MEKFIISKEALDVLKELKNCKRWSMSRICMQLGISVNTWRKMYRHEAISEMVAYRVKSMVELIKEGKFV